ncbi:GNAT family N-acetyltransferase [Paenibacillus sp. AN1007]|uniref:GNAT family N-acetyltransferase n=1 Tax=Paenibacillus sp. AN1007 TaxID=3151385 RepID=A0AAU8NAW7_9BACL
MIQLKTITNENFDECIRLDLEDEQWKYVAANMYSIAGAYVAITNNDFIPMLYAIYNEEAMVGFIAMSYERDARGDYFYDIYRFMIDKRYQKKGYGKQALTAAVEILKSQPQGKASVAKIIYTKDNVVAKKLYEAVGFIDTGKTNEDGDIIAHFPLEN